MDVKDRLQSAISHQTNLNPVDRLQKGVSLVLGEVLDERKELEEMQKMKIEVSLKGPFAKLRTQSKIRKKRNFIQNKLLLNQEVAFQLACLSSFLTQKMKATDDFVALLKRIEHPFIDLIIAYFEEDPSTYQATRMTIDKLAKTLMKRSDYTSEMEAFVFSIRAWVYGQLGDVHVLKELYKNLRKRLLETENIVEIFGLLDTACNAIWWLLQSGVDSNIHEMIEFIQPYITKYRFYFSHTNFLNLKGAVHGYFGDNTAAIASLEELKTEYEKYNDNYRLSIAIGNLSDSYFIEGKILLAKDMLERAINLYKESTGKWPYLYLSAIGDIYYLVGDPRAEESFLLAYELQKKEPSLFKAFILSEVIHFYLRTEQLEKIPSYLKEMKSLAKELQAISVNANIDYLLGYNEMLEQNFSNAIKYLQKSLELSRQSRDFDLILSCNILLAAVYLHKYKLDEKPSILNSVLNYIDTAIQLAVENKHNQILSLGLIIRALLRARKGEFKLASKDINEVKRIEKEIDYEKWKNDLIIIEEQINKAQSEGKMELDLESVFKYVLPQFKTLLSFKLAERKPKETKVMGVLIITESGVPIYTNLGKSLKTDKMILSGLLTAINQLSESIVEGKDEGRLREVLYEKFLITIQPIKNGIVAVIATEATAEIRLWANAIADRVVEVPVVISQLTSKLDSEIGDIITQMKIK
ncbi:MAG: tetratricopeptide repeat protein [Candidatus Heimdallarchaeaceae archaeon]